MVFDLTNEKRIHIEQFYHTKKQAYDCAQKAVSFVQDKIQSMGTTNCPENLFSIMASNEENRLELLETMKDTTLLRTLLFQMKKYLFNAKGKKSIFQKENYLQLKEYAKVYEDCVLKNQFDIKQMEYQDLDYFSLHRLKQMKVFIKTLNYQFLPTYSLDLPLSSENYALVCDYTCIQDVVFHALDKDFSYDEMMKHAYLFFLFQKISHYSNDMAEEEKLKRNDIDSLISIALNQIKLKDKKNLSENEKLYLQEISHYLNCYSRKTFLFAKNELYAKALNLNSTLHRQEEEEQINEAIITLVRHQRQTMPK